MSRLPLSSASSAAGQSGMGVPWKSTPRIWIASLRLELPSWSASPLEKGARSGLVEVGDILTGVEDISFIRFGGEDVVRHKLVQRIVAAYGEHSERKA